MCARVKWSCNMISKEVINAGLTGYYPVVVLSDESTGTAVQIDGYDYSYFRINEGMNDQEIMDFAGTA